MSVRSPTTASASHSRSSATAYSPSPSGGSSENVPTRKSPPNCPSGSATSAFVGDGMASWPPRASSDSPGRDAEELLRDVVGDEGLTVGPEREPRRPERERSLALSERPADVLRERLHGAVRERPRHLVAVRLGEQEAVAVVALGPRHRLDAELLAHERPGAALGVDVDDARRVHEGVVDHLADGRPDGDVQPRLEPAAAVGTSASKALRSTPTPSSPGEVLELHEERDLEAVDRHRRRHRPVGGRSRRDLGELLGGSLVAGTLGQPPVAAGEDAGRRRAGQAPSPDRGPAGPSGGLPLRYPVGTVVVAPRRVGWCHRNPAVHHGRRHRYTGGGVPGTASGRTIRARRSRWRDAPRGRRRVTVGV